MKTCFILFLLYAVSVLVSSFALFRLSKPMKEWINRIEESTKSSLIEIANLSDVEALKVFRTFLLGTAIVLFAALFLLEKVIAQNVQHIIALGGALFLYSGLSVNTWSTRRAEILKEFVERTKNESRKVTKYFSIFSVLILIIIGMLSVVAGEKIFVSFGPLLLLLGAGLLVLVLATVMANTFALGLVFAPAIMALAYLRVVIIVARGALAVGKDKLFNGLLGYSIAGTLYFALLGLSGLRSWLSIPAICQ